ncbi:PD40 domain-containing protein [bacterium]|nr:PD40 domain-containing protein [bacterium]
MILRTVAALLLSSLLLPAEAARAQPEPLLLANQPAFSPDGAWIAFTYGGDLWKVPSRGGRALRLTAHPDRETKPVFTPDGKWIVFASDRQGLYDLYVMPADGGSPRRLTWHGSATEYPHDVSPDGSYVFFHSNRDGYRDLYRVPFSGGTPVRISGEYMTMEYYPVVSPDGKTLAFCRRSIPGGMVRGGYHGTQNADIWLADNTVPLSNFRQVTTYDGHDMFPVFARDGDGLYFISERDDVQNVYYVETSRNQEQAAARREKIRQVTEFTDGSILHLAISRDGRTLAFVRDYALWTASARTGRAQPLRIELASDTRENPLFPQTWSGNASEYSVSSDQKKVAYIVGHDVWITSADESTASRQVTRTPERETAPLWFPDSRRLLFISMRDGNREIYAYDAVLQSTTRLTDTPEDESSLLWSPDGRTLAYLSGERRLMHYDPATGAHTLFAEVYYPQAGLYQRDAFCWSPDGCWMAYVTNGPQYTEALSVREVTGAEPRAVTRYMRDCEAPAWSPDGKKLAFIGTEGGQRDLFVVDLVRPPEEKFAVDEFDRLFVAAPPRAASPAASASPEVSGKIKKATPEKKPPVEINFDGIQERLRKLTGGEAGEWTPRWSTDSDEIYFLSGMSGATQLWSTPVDPAGEKKRAMITSTSGGKSNLTLAPDGKTAWFLEGGLARKVNLSNKSVTAAAFRGETLVDRQALRRAALHEAWWVMDRYFYDREHHGVDWAAALDEARRVLPAVASDEDLAWVLGNLIGAMQSSHTGVSTRQPWSESRRPHKYLGFRLDPVQLSQGRFVVSEVLRDGPADQPQARLAPGEEVLAVNGAPLAASDCLDEILAHALGDKVALTLAPPTASGTREVGLRPLTSRRAYFDLLYENWVHHNRDYVKERSEGRLGYLHVRAMDNDALERFKRELPGEAAGKDGLLLDVRGNPGGHIAVHILEILIKRPFIYREVGELGKISENLLRSLALEKPTVLLINERSGSNSEILAEGFRRLGLGRIVGIATPGDVIGTGSFELVNGFQLRRPYIGAYTLEGKNLEGKGRLPDIWIDETPEDDLAGRRPQLDAAIETLLGRIQSAAVK